MPSSSSRIKITIQITLFFFKNQCSYIFFFNHEKFRIPYQNIVAKNINNMIRRHLSKSSPSSIVGPAVTTSTSIFHPHHQQNGHGNQIFIQIRNQGWAGVMSGDNVLSKNSKYKKIAQSDGVDDLVRVKAEQQRWLDHEQYEGYSDSYLKRSAKFKSQFEIMGNRSSGYGGPLRGIDDICKIVYSIYGEAADVLEELEANPLHPQFSEMLATAVARRKTLEEKIDEDYAELHPTMKTMYDSMLVKRWQTLDDWIQLVQKKRDNTLNKLTPEWIEELEKRRGIAENFKARLKHLGTAMEANPVAFLEGSGFSEEEMAMIERRKRFFKKQKTFGHAIGYNDYSPH